MREAVDVARVASGAEKAPDIAERLAAKGDLAGACKAAEARRKADEAAAKAGKDGCKVAAFGWYAPERPAIMPRHLGRFGAMAPHRRVRCG